MKNIFFTSVKKGYIFGRVGFVFLSVRKQDYLQSNERIHMKLLPEVCLGPRNNLFLFGDDPDYDLDRAAEVCS